MTSDSDSYWGKFSPDEYMSSCVATMRFRWTAHDRQTERNTHFGLVTS